MTRCANSIMGSVSATVYTNVAARESTKPAARACATATIEEILRRPCGLAGLGAPCEDSDTDCDTIPVEPASPACPDPAAPAEDDAPPWDAWDEYCSRLDPSNYSEHFAAAAAEWSGGGSERVRSSYAP